MGRINRRVVSPEEFARTGRWLEYMDDEGNPVRMKGGGSARSPYAYLTEETYYPASPIVYLSGDSGGQDDKVRRDLLDGSYVMPADVVADAGDGNSLAGEKKIKALVSHGEMEISPQIVSKLGNGDNDLGAKKLDMFVKNIRKHKRGGKVNLPPRSKSLESYLRG